MQSHQPRQLGRAGSRTRICHPGQAQIGRVGQNCGEQEHRVLGWFKGLILDWIEHANAMRFRG